MDRDPYNGWPNTFTWQLFCHLSSYADISEMAYQLVADASAPHLGADRLREWVQEDVDGWLERAALGWLTLLSTDLLHAALGQVDWDRLAAAFREAAS